PGPRLVPAVLGWQGGHRRDPQAARGGLQPGLAGGDAHVARGGLARRQALEGIRDLMTAAVQERPGRVSSFLKLVAIEHSVFALPFAYLSALTAMQLNGGRVRWGDLLLITVAMVGAR